jgi:hypothetical protein
VSVLIDRLTQLSLDCSLIGLTLADVEYDLCKVVVAVSRTDAFENNITTPKYWHSNQMYCSSHYCVCRADAHDVVTTLSYTIHLLCYP